MDGPTACSRALQITEIVRMICEEAELWPRQQKPKTCASLARVSKIFSDPALDVVWRQQDSLVLLVKCMPDTLWEQRGLQAKRNLVVHLRRPITSTDLPRLLFYTVRVKTLFVKTNLTHGTVDTEFLQALDMCMDTQVFMPKLSDLSWGPEKPVLSFVRRFFGPQIQRINLTLDNSNTALSLLPYTRSSCPRVSVFELEGLKSDPPTARVLSDTICGWQYLRELRIASLDEAGLTHIANLDCLTKLNLYSLKEGQLHPPDFLHGLSFPALTSLLLTCDTARFCSDFIRGISSRQLEELSIYPSGSWTASAWTEVLTSIHDCLDHDTLGSIDVDQWGERSRPVNTAPYILSSDSLRPLLSFKHLHHLAFQMYHGVDVDDDFLEEIAIAWPDLISLESGTDLKIRERPSATLDCLIHFARHSPSLENLGIRMDVSGDVPQFSHIPGQRIDHCLNSLRVGTSPIAASSTSTTEVAAFLSNLFPDLECLFSYDGNLTGALEAYRDSWSRVSDMLPIFCLVRSQEKAFWRKDLTDEDGSESSSEEDASADGNSTLEDA
ncbi:hypothetical protein C8R43DRAFT_1061545 [Mycena crocata]|nr:hypothetical protein C8R43DRAFT_1061545 [Mycena crocata]